MKQTFYFSVIILLTCVTAIGQNNPVLTVPKAATINVNDIKTDWQISLQNLESPLIGNETYQGYLKQIKNEIAKKYPRKTTKNINNNITFTTDTPVVLKNFEGNIFGTGVPNDNTLAISNNGILVTAINSNIYMFDTDNNMLLKTVSLNAFSAPLNVASNQYDPKLFYDPEQDKFIIVYLAGTTDNNSNIVVGFSQTNNPTGNWNLYKLPGNPLNDTSWTDYPAIAVSKHELFITVNLLINNEPWQTAFKRSIIWQINKFNGYSGDSLNPKLWDNISFNGKRVRNLHPIIGGDGLYGPDMYFLSNRNFDIQNDSVFIVHITDTIGCCASLNVNVVKADKSYGVPPDARQVIITMHQYKLEHILATNDARILGGFYHNNKIQFVSNTIDTTTGFAAVYHGIIANLKTTPHIHGNIITDDTLDFGYPNISYADSGTGTTDYAIITFNHTAPTVFSGFSGMFYNTTDNYSQRVTLKIGLNYVDVISGVYERWGDYSGSQRKYNELGTVWVGGSFGRMKNIGMQNWRVNGTWIAELKVPHVKSTLKSSESILYPNPITDKDIIHVEFDLPEKTYLEITIYDINGKLIKELYNSEAKAGINLLEFSTTPLSQGFYFLTIKDSKRIIYSEKLVVGN